MSKKPLAFIILSAAIILSACNAETTPQATETAIEPPAATLVQITKPPTETATATLTPTNQPTQGPAPTIAPTATLPPPENPADCTNAGRFISDVTIPDNSEVAIGEVFTKTWRVQNTGTCIWWEGYSVRHYSEGAFGATDSVPLPRTNPGERADISVDLLAPDIAGFYRGNFVLQNPLGLAMEIEGDSRLWVIFNAVDNGTPLAEPTTTPTSDENSGNDGDATLNQANCDYLLEDTRKDGVFAALSTYRVEEGLTPYAMNQELSNAAQSHAQDIACNHLFVHTGSDGSTPQTRAESAGYIGIRFSENLYGSNPPLSPEEVKEWWRLDETDPIHNLNLINTDFTDIGIGYAFFGDFGYYVVVFGQAQ